MVAPKQEQLEETRGTGMRVPFDHISEPGTYVFNYTGHLLRVPEDAITQGRSPLVNILGRETVVATKISEDPFMPVTKCRLVAANHDVPVNF